MIGHPKRWTFKRGEERGKWEDSLQAEHIGGISGSKLDK